MYRLQAETYRRMKKATKNDWQAHVPVTNVYWMQYMVDICMTEVRLGLSCVPPFQYLAHAGCTAGRFVG